MRHYLAVLFLLIILGLPWAAMNYPDGMNALVSAIENAGNQLAAVILAHNPRSIAEIQLKYKTAAIPQAPKVKILIVPGHEPDYGGAEYVDPVYGHMYERDLTVELGQDLQGFLQNDVHYQTFITRDAGAWNPVFASYFKDDWNQIIAWQKAYRRQFSQMIANGTVTLPTPQVDHASAPSGVALRLYGITKWSNENNIDLEIHIHFNDYPGHGSQPGKYTGFAIYVPAAQYENGTTTHAIADMVFKRLAKYNPVSDLPGESLGVVDDPELIALGANDTADAASMLIEYSYIYEPQIDDPVTRSQAIKDMAYQTYLGLEDFFDPSKSAGLARAYDTVALPYTWKDPISAVGTTGPDVFALQTALVEDGDYPPAGRTMNDCPRSGKLGPCTKTGIQTFQDKHGITGEQGVAGPKTIDQLNQLFSAKII